MKKVLSIILIMFVSNVHVKASEKWGEGELHLKRGVVNYFI